MTGTPTSSALHTPEASSSMSLIITSPPIPTTSTTSSIPSSTTTPRTCISPLSGKQYRLLDIRTSCEDFSSTSYANSHLEWTSSASFLLSRSQSWQTASTSHPSYQYSEQYCRRYSYEN
ncbi:uncharacterized protein DS421_2g37120 [Arachis hypogaea]|nr:uncharacterized protein DS421_2g37120 [Arachis hypogaea]